MIESFKSSNTYNTQTRYSNEDLDKLEEKLGYKLDDLYKQFMSEVGAGYFSIDYNVELPVGVIFESFYPLEVIERLFESYKENEIPEGYIPFGADNAGNLFCFKKNKDKIFFVDHNFDSISEVAKDFKSFLKLINE